MSNKLLLFSVVRACNLQCYKLTTKRHVHRGHVRWIANAMRSNLKSVAQIILKIFWIVCQKFYGLRDLGHAPLGEIIRAPARVSIDEAVYQI